MDLVSKIFLRTIVGMLLIFSIRLIIFNQYGMDIVSMIFLSPIILFFAWLNYLLWKKPTK